ncbi:MAG: hypothetical protein ABH865_04445 [Candidatus Omnitrophota bacterium]|nr:hypothetical protein [Candidatus Omnitrophota bacterium]
MRILVASIAVGIVCATIAANHTLPCLSQDLLRVIINQLLCSIVGFSFGTYSTLSVFCLFSRRAYDFSPLVVAAGLIGGAIAGLLFFYFVLAAVSLLMLRSLLFMPSWVSSLVLNLTRLGSIIGCALYAGSHALRVKKPLPKNFFLRFVSFAIGSLILFLPLIFLWTTC